jgi:hypothetical protein
MNEAENLDRLMGSLVELGFYRPDLHSYLESSEVANTIPYRQQDRIGDDLMDYQLTIKRRQETGELYPESYQATLLKTHPVPHRRFGQIDTLDLEKRIKGVDWDKYVRDTSANEKEIASISEDIFELGVSRNSDARDIARRLQMRYWLHTPIEQYLTFGKYVGDYEKTHQFTLNNDFSDISAREAYNLLSGRGVLKFYQKENEPGNLYTHWKVIDEGQLKTLLDYDFMKMLKQLPLAEMQIDRTGPQLIYDLIRGERPAVTLLKDNRQVPAFVEADPREQSLNLYSRDLQKLDLNEFLPKESRQIKQPPKITGPKRKLGKNKGWSL